MHADEGIDALIADVNAEAENAQNSQVTEEPKILDEEDSFLNALTAEFKEEESTSPGTSPKLAAVMGKIWQGKFNEEQAKAHLNRYEKPENCDNLQVQKVNPQIWNSVLPQYRSSDIKIQKLKSILCKATVPMLQCADTFMTQKELGKNDMKILLEKTLDAIALISNANQVLTSRRREIMKPGIHHTYQQLCTNVPVGSALLFGDDINQRNSNIASTNKVLGKVRQKDLRSKPEYSHNKSKNYARFPKESSSTRGKQYHNHRSNKPRTNYKQQ